jgi:CrcB protein
MIVRLALLALTGAIGTLARYGIQNQARTRDWSPWLGTLTVNLAGCFAFGVVWGLLDRRGLLESDLRLVLLTGFFGAFTTFSGLIGDSAGLARHGDATVAVINLALSVVLGSALLVGGVLLSRGSFN